MTTPPIMSVTDELIAELQDVAHGKDEDAIEVHGVSVGIVRALLSERAEYRRLLAEQEQIMQSLRDSECALMNEVAELKRDAERRVPLYEAVERACGELPDGWSINLCMERGAGWIELYDDCGVHIDGFPTNNERLDYTLNDAIDAAMTP